MIGPSLPRTALLAVSLALAMAVPALPAAAQTADPGPAPAAAPDLDQRFVAWVAASGDNNGLPFVIIDKNRGRHLRLRPGGRLDRTEAALVGAALGDDFDAGHRRPRAPHHKAGRAHHPRRSLRRRLWPGAGQGKGLVGRLLDRRLLHAVITTNPSERRLQRLQSPAPEDNRITFGCINVSAEFYKTVVSATLTDRAIVYVLPDSKPVAQVFPSFGL